MKNMRFRVGILLGALLFTQIFSTYAVAKGIRSYYAYGQRQDTLIQMKGDYVILSGIFFS